MSQKATETRLALAGFLPGDIVRVKGHTVLGRVVKQYEECQPPNHPNCLVLVEWARKYNKLCAYRRGSIELVHE